jgi:ketosteroid isomerase-like protein
MEDVFMDRDRMEEYYKTFNTGNLEALETFYTDDVVLEYQDLLLKGRDAVLGHFKEYFHTVREQITPLQIFINDTDVAVELNDTLTAKIDLPDLMGKPVKAGESVSVKFGGFYKVRGDRICHVKLYG